MMPNTLTEPATPTGLADVQTLADEFAAEIERAERAVRKGPHADATALHALTVAALGDALTLAATSRDASSLTVAQFVFAALRLRVILDRLSKPPAALRAWPKTPGSTLAQFAGDSALGVGLQFAHAVNVAAIWGAGVVTAHGRYPAAFGSLCVAEPHVDPAIEAWRVRTIAELRTHTLPPADRWAAWEMRRDAGKLESLIYDELRRACEAPATLEQRPAGKAANPPLGKLDEPMEKVATIARIVNERSDHLRRDEFEGKAATLQKRDGLWYVSEREALALLPKYRDWKSKKSRA